MPLRFEWDARKAARNLKKHGVSFDEASTVFADPFSVSIPDPDHARPEERWVTVGDSCRRRLLVVVHTERDERIRVISAREAGQRERTKYEEGIS